MEHLRALRPEAVAERLLAEPEGQWFDRKSARIEARRLAESLVALANADGGTIVIGLSGGICEGVDGYRRAQNEWRRAGINHTAPPVRFTADLLPCVNGQGKPDHLFVIQIAASQRGIHTTGRDEAFLRVGDSNQRMTFDQRTELQYDRGDTSFEVTPARAYGREMLDEVAVAGYAAQLGHPAPWRLLQARDLVDADGTVSIAGQLLFGIHPQRTNPEAYVRVLRYAGTERHTGAAQNLVSDERCEGTLPQQINAARQALQQTLPRRKALGPEGKFHWVDPIPEEAWLEALVNAVIHRAYSNFGDHTRLTVFDDRVEVASPGRFPGIVRPGDLTGVRRFARNPRIARVMAELSYGQELGEGLRRMAAAMAAAGKPSPRIEQSAGGVTVTLPIRSG